MTIASRLIALVLIAGSVMPMGCASRRGEYVPPAMSEPVGRDDTSQREAQLRELVQRRRIQEAHSREENQQEVKRKAPYFYKEYGVYPETDDIKIEIQETESRSYPVRASVVVPKVRYSTRLHRGRDDALRDTTFVRDTGSETQEYSLRNGRWVSLGNTFVAERSEVQVNGEWLPVREEDEVRSTPEEDDRGGWFSRVWGSVTGN